MNAPIKAGDPVMLVWGCCAAARKFIGWVGEVESLRQTHTKCGVCLHESNSLHAQITVSHTGVVPLSWLRKMPPQRELEQEPRDEEITA